MEALEITYFHYRTYYYIGISMMVLSYMVTILNDKTM